MRTSNWHKNSSLLNRSLHCVNVPGVFLSNSIQRKNNNTVVHRLKITTNLLLKYAEFEMSLQNATEMVMEFAFILR